MVAVSLKKKIKHKPVSDGNCQNCHDPHQSDFSAFLKSQVPQLCVKCHEKIGKQLNAENVHPPFEENCLNCHEVHSSKEDHLINQKIPDLCYNCHDEKTNKEYVHSPVQEGNCIACHSPHASSEEKFLLFEEKKLCLNCHNKSISKELKTIVNIKRLLQKDNFIHGAIEMGGCSICHDPHTSENKFLLVSSFPAGKYAIPAKTDSFALCFNCHDSELLEKAVTTTATGFRNGDQNLHYLHVNRNKGRNCTNCHNVHGSKNEHLIAGKVQFGNWEMPIKYTAQENGGTCLPGCHKEKKYAREPLIIKDPIIEQNNDSINEPIRH